MIINKTRSSRTSRTGRWLGALIALAFVSLASSPSLISMQAPVSPARWEGGAALADAPDLNTDPRIVEINLEARVADVEIATGQRVAAWTYNGGLPGPLIRVRVGDRLIVHFTNRLPAPTTVHWHGLRVPIQMDGVPGISQPDVAPGGTFTYDFVVPDAGLYWYHPHVMSAAQVGFGLYGALLVDDPAESFSTPIDEVVMVLSDIEVDERGTLEDPDSGGSTGMAFGREGNHILVNGRERPTLIARPGVAQRWRIVNAAKSRYFEIDPDGPRFTTIGGDGGLQAAPVESSTLVVAPGERLDVLFIPPGAAGQELVIDWRLFNRGYGSVEARIPLGPLFDMRLAGPAGAVLGRPQAPSRPIEPLSLAGATETKIELTIAQTAKGEFEYGINGIPFFKNKMLHARPGETQIWHLVNSTAWSHPFHLHGFFFQVLGENGQPVRPLAWKDTVNVPFKSALRIAVRFDGDRPGEWMFHCHVLDHADGGLMGTVLVGDPQPGSATTQHVHPTP